MVYNFDHFVAAVKMSFFLMACVITRNRCTNFFILSSHDEHIGCFQVFTLMDCAAVNAGLQIVSSYADLTSLEYIPRSGLAR